MEFHSFDFVVQVSQARGSLDEPAQMIAGGHNDGSYEARTGRTPLPPEV